MDDHHESTKSPLRREITQNKNQHYNPLTQYTPREEWASSFKFTTKMHLSPLFKWEISAHLVLRRDFGGVIAHKKISAQLPRRTKHHLLSFIAVAKLKFC